MKTNSLDVVGEQADELKIPEEKFSLTSLISHLSIPSNLALKSALISEKFQAEYISEYPEVCRGQHFFSY